MNNNVALEKCFNEKRCTMTEYRGLTLQPAYYCFDCFGDDFPICFSCIEKCHQNHKTKKIENQYYGFKCSCGANTRCCALDIQTLLFRTFDESRMEECYEEGICSTIATGRNYTPKEYYKCLDCEFPTNHSLCKVCIDKCHQGHLTKLVSISESGFFCDCGLKESCKCNVLPKNIGLFNPEHKDSILNKFIHIFFLIPEIKLMILKQDFKEEILKELKKIFIEMITSKDKKYVVTMKIERLFNQYVKKFGLSYNYTDIWRLFFNLLKMELKNFQNLFIFQIEVEVECKECNIMNSMSFEDDYFQLYLWNTSIEDGFKKYVENKKISCGKCNKSNQIKSINIIQSPTIMVVLIQDLKLEKKENINLEYHLELKKFSNKNVEYDLVQILTKNKKNDLLIREKENQWVKCGKYNTYFNINDIKSLDNQSLLIYRTKLDEKISKNLNIESQIKELCIFENVNENSKKIEEDPNSYIIYHIYLPKFFQLASRTIYIPKSKSYFYGKGDDYFHIKLSKNATIDELKEVINKRFSINDYQLFYLQYGVIEIANIVTQIYCFDEYVVGQLYKPKFRYFCHIMAYPKNAKVTKFTHNNQYDDCVVCLSCNEIHDNNIYPWKKYEGNIICLNCSLQYPEQKITSMELENKFKLNVVKKNYINVLPDDIIFEILSFIPRDKEMRNLRFVSFQWNYLIQKNYPQCLSIKKLTKENVDYEKIWKEEQKYMMKDHVVDLIKLTTYFGITTVLTGIPIEILCSSWFYYMYNTGVLTNLPKRVIQYGINELKQNKPKERKITDTSWVDIESNGDNVIIRKLDVNEPLVKIFNLDYEIQKDYFNDTISKTMIPQEWIEKCDECKGKIIGTKYLCQDCLDRPVFCENCFTNHFQHHYFKLFTYYTNQ